MDISEINEVRIHFNPVMVQLMNAALAFIMFGIALHLKATDFTAVWRQPKKVLIGLSSQLLLLPLFTLSLIYLANVPYSIALGMILVASCPGGNISNFATHLARGNTALSITMTTIVTLSATILTPLSFYIWSGRLPGVTPETLSLIQVNPWQMLWIVAQLILFPIIAGMLLQKYAPRFTYHIRKYISILSLSFFFTFILGAIYSNWSLIVDYLFVVFWLVVVHNGVAYIIAYGYAKSWGLPAIDARAISLETGVQNAGLGLVLVLHFFEELGGMMLVVAFWGVWDLVSSFLLAMWWRQKTAISASTI